MPVEPDNEFSIELWEVEREDLPWAVDEYKVTFEVERDGHSFTAAVWIEIGAVPTADLIRVAMSMLHLTLKQLAAQTEAWRMSPN